MASTPEDRIRNEYRALKRGDYPRSVGIGWVRLFLARKWTRLLDHPVTCQDIRRIWETRPRHG